MWGAGRDTWAMERAYRVLLWSTHFRWIGLGIAVFVLAPVVDPGILTAAVLCCALYNMVLILVTARVRWFRRWYRVVTIGAPAIDLMLVTLAIAAPEVTFQPLTAFYLLPIVTVSATYGIRSGMLVAGISSVFLWIARCFFAAEWLIPLYVAWIALFFFGAFGTVLATPLFQRMRALDELFRRMEELYELGREPSRPENLGIALQMAVDAAHTQLDAEYTLLYLYNHDSKALELRHFQPSNACDEFPVVVTPGHDIPGYVFQSNTPLLLGELEARTPIPVITDVTHEARAGRTVMAVPVRSGDNIMGALTIYGSPEREPFDPDDLRILLLIATHIASAIENARLLEELQKMAQTDQLTGLYNRRYFD
ncbi:MAG TPA: GAF domain-containing protein [Armatimonadetes bacterium]|nr:GAF domain-containing protein [Armatimonadota bacterium]